MSVKNATDQHLHIALAENDIRSILAAGRTIKLQIEHGYAMLRQFHERLMALVPDGTRTFCETSLNTMSEGEDTFEAFRKSRNVFWVESILDMAHLSLTKPEYADFKFILSGCSTKIKNDEVEEYGFTSREDAISKLRYLGRKWKGLITVRISTGDSHRIEVSFSLDRKLAEKFFLPIQSSQTP